MPFNGTIVRCHWNNGDIRPHTHYLNQPVFENTAGLFVMFTTASFPSFFAPCDGDGGVHAIAIFNIFIDPLSLPRYMYMNSLCSKNKGEKAKFCSFHKSASMIDVRSRRCAAPGCKRQPSYAIEGKRAAFCAAHQEEGMVDVVSRRCEHPNCRRRPLYGYEVGARCGEERGVWCSAVRCGQALE